MPVLEGLLKYIDENIVPFHMPGHKNNRRGFEELEIIRKNLYKMDNTEVPGLDNLHMPEEMILKAEKMAARAYGADKSFFLINGSTSGIYSMILGTTRPGDRIIVQRNCHRSVHMACLIGSLDAVYINPTVLDGFNIAVSLDIDEVKETMDKNRDAKAIVLTYPTYYGTCSNLEEIVREAHKRNMLVLVDEAHGAHLPFSKKLPKSAMECGADISVASLHKTTPALTQTALLNVNKGIDPDGVRFMMRLFQSTSPSYVLMASIDAARHIMERRGEELLDELLENIYDLKNKISRLGYYRVLDEGCKGKASIYDVDLTKIVIKSPFGGRRLEEILRKNYGIQVEMSDIYNATLISSVGDTKDSFEMLYKALYEISQKNREDKTIDLKFKMPGFQPSINMREAYYRPKRKVKFKESAGLISAEMIAPYPPGIPVVLPGEVITYDIIEYIELIKANNIPLNGIEDGTANYIYVVE
ncbi:aminotransferase class I/II-fold pyridoxal phosphate-dependent enzyme [Fonticella tunisiensis]|nr:aminotransferase class V-fold PLP-dependent enzyme [Fonticella tunisiensis]